MWNKLEALHHHFISHLTFDKALGKGCFWRWMMRCWAMWWSGEMWGDPGLRGGEINPVWCQQQGHLCMSTGPRERYRTPHDGSSVDVWVVMWLAVALDEQVVACATRGWTCKWMTECWLVLLNTSARFISLCDFHYSYTGFMSKSNHVMKVFQEKRRGEFFFLLNHLTYSLFLIFISLAF